MKTWKRLPTEVTCGGCGTRLAKQTPVMEITIVNVRARKYRCAECAGPAPPDLPEAIVLKPEQPGGFEHIATAAKTAREWLPYPND